MFQLCWTFFLHLSSDQKCAFEYVFRLCWIFIFLPYLCDHNCVLECNLNVLNFYFSLLLVRPTLWIWVCVSIIFYIYFSPVFVRPKPCLLSMCFNCVLFLFLSSIHQIRNMPLSMFFQLCWYFLSKFLHVTLGTMQSKYNNDLQEKHSPSKIV